MKHAGCAIPSAVQTESRAYPNGRTHPVGPEAISSLLMYQCALPAHVGPEALHEKVLALEYAEHPAHSVEALQHY